MVREIHSFRKGAGLEVVYVLSRYSSSIRLSLAGLTNGQVESKGSQHIAFKTVISLYEDLHSCVRTKRFTSDWFPVNQGTRQGGSSSYIYTSYLITIYWPNLTSAHIVL